MRIPITNNALSGPERLPVGAAAASPQQQQLNPLDPPPPPPLSSRLVPQLHCAEEPEPDSVVALGRGRACARGSVAGSQHSLQVRAPSASLGAAAWSLMTERCSSSPGFRLHLVFSVSADSRLMLL